MHTNMHGWGACAFASHTPVFLDGCLRIPRSFLNNFFAFPALRFCAPMFQILLHLPGSRSSTESLSPIHLPCPPPYCFAFHVPLLLYKICIPRSLVTLQNLHSHSSEAQERGNRNLLMQDSHRNYEWFLSHLSLKKIG